MAFKRLVFRNQSNTINVAYVTDMFSNEQENFTVQEIEGLSDSEVDFGLYNKQLSYSITEFKQFAEDNNLKLSLEDEDGSTTLTGYDASFSASLTGLD